MWSNSLSLVSNRATYRQKRFRWNKMELMKNNNNNNNKVVQKWENLCVCCFECERRLSNADTLSYKIPFNSIDDFHLTDPILCAYSSAHIFLCLCWFGYFFLRQMMFSLSHKKNWWEYYKGHAMKFMKSYTTCFIFIFCTKQNWTET